MAIQVGQEAPDFTLRDPEGNDVTLSRFRGARNVLLLFYPAAFSSVCTAQLTGVGAQAGRLADLDAQVLGVSVDSRHSQDAFARELGLTDAILLADFEPKGEVARRYDVYLDKVGIATRASFVIDRDGIVRDAQITAVPSDLPDEDAYIAALSACQI